jgi:hypothetical protein
MRTANLGPLSGGIAEVIVSPVIVLAAIHATTELSPICQLRPSLTRVN